MFQLLRSWSELIDDSYGGEPFWAHLRSSKMVFEARNHIWAPQMSSKMVVEVRITIIAYDIRRIRKNNCNNFYDIYCRLRCSWAKSRDENAFYIWQGLMILKIYSVYICSWLHMNVIIYIYILPLVFCHWNSMCAAIFYNETKVVHGGFLEYVVNALDSWFNESYTPWVHFVAPRYLIVRMATSKQSLNWPTTSTCACAVKGLGG